VHQEKKQKYDYRICTLEKGYRNSHLRQKSKCVWPQNPRSRHFRERRTGESCGLTPGGKKGTRRGLDLSKGGGAEGGASRALRLVMSVKKGSCQGMSAVRKEGN